MLAATRAAFAPLAGRRATAALPAFACRGMCDAADKPRRKRRVRVRKAAAEPEFVNEGDAIPVNVLKNGQDPVVLADSEYPEWLFKLVEPEPTLHWLEENYEGASDEDKARYWDLKQRAVIKEQNLIASTS